MRLAIVIEGASLLLIGASAVNIAHCDTPQGGERHGAEVFDKWCAPCHAAGPNHPGTQALDAKYMGTLPGPLQERRDLTPGMIRTFVRQGVSIMPFFRKTEITDSNLDALSAYLAK